MNEIWEVVGTESKRVLEKCPEKDCQRLLIIGGKMPDESAAKGRVFMCASCFSVYLASQQETKDWERRYYAVPLIHRMQQAPTRQVWHTRQQRKLGAIDDE